MNKALQHLKTVRRHRRAVRRSCWKMGLFWQGLLHDLSKYSPVEFREGTKYYNGVKSPLESCREDTGYSRAWIHHKSNNKHHWEYWIDNSTKFDFTPVKIPYKYVIEMFCDFIGAGKAYSRENWTPDMPLIYHLRTKENRLFHKATLKLFEKLLRRLKYLGERDFYKWYKQNKRQLKIEYDNL